MHVRISCPPTISPCFYGVDTPSRSELIAATHTLEEITKYLDADSVGYLSLEGLMTAVGSQRGSYCSSCYTGVYPVPFPQDQASYLQLALKLDRKEPITNRRQGAGAGTGGDREHEALGERMLSVSNAQDAEHQDGL